MNDRDAMPLDEIDDEAERRERSTGADEPEGKPNGGARVNGSGQSPKILTSKDFVAGFIAPDYLIHRLVQRRFIYSLTAPTGAGKTAVALLLALHVADGRSLGDLTVEKGRVLIFAGENPDDIRARWLAMAQHHDFDVNTIEVDFIPGKFSIAELLTKVTAERMKVGSIALIIVDTSAVYFEGDQENDNVQAGNHARMLRDLTRMPGGPCVIVNCHPVKNAGPDNLLPRGGGAFLNEVDGNLVLHGSSPMVELSWLGKLRGPGFEPIPFRIDTVECTRVKDSQGRPVPTVIARHISEREQREIAAKAQNDQNALLIAMLDIAGASFAQLAEKLTWMTGERGDKPHKSKVSRMMVGLEKDKLVRKERNTWVLTEKGTAEAEKVKLNFGLAGARY